MTLDIDRLLTDDAEKWRSTLPPGPGPAAALGEEPQPRSPRRHVVLAVAASVAGVLVAAGVVLGIHWSSSTSNSTLGPQFSGRCQDNFVVEPSDYRPSPPLATRDLQITLAYRGIHPCRVSAYGPFMELRDANGNLLGTGENTNLLRLDPDYLVVRDGSLLDLAVRWSPPCPSAPRVTTAILHLGGGADRSGAGVPVPVPKDFTPVCQPYDFAAFTGFVEYPKVIAGLTAAQRNLALRIAHQEAATSYAGRPSGIASGVWPANVDSVSAIVTTAKDGAQYVGGSTGAQGDVLVVRLIGRFSLVTSGPPGSGDATGNEFNVLVPLDTKRVTDGGVDTQYPAADLPNSTNLFQR